MNFKTTLFLLVLLGVVGIAVFFVNRQPAPDDQTATAEGETKLLDVDPNKVNRLVVAPAAGERVAFERRQGTWRLTEPVAAAADSFEVDALVREVAELRSRNRVDPSGDTTGLDRPQYTLDVTDDAGKTQTIKVGSKSAVGDILYVQLGDRAQADVVNAGLLAQLEKPAGSYRQAKLVETTQEQIQSVSVTRPDGAVKIERAGLDWKITEPEAMPGDASEVSSLLLAITGMNAVEFVAEDAKAKAAQYGLEQPVMTVSYQTKPAPPLPGAATTTPATTQGGAAATQATTAPAASQPAPTTIKCGRYEDVLKKNVYASIEGGPIVKVAATTLDTLRKSPLDLRDRRVLDVAPEAAQRITIARDLRATTQPTKRDARKSTVVLVKQEEKIAPAGPPAPTPATKPAGAATQPAAPGTAPTAPAAKPAAAQPPAAGSAPAPAAPAPAAPKQPGASPAAAAATEREPATPGAHGGDLLLAPLPPRAPGGPAVPADLRAGSRSRRRTRPAEPAAKWAESGPQGEADAREGAVAAHRAAPAAARSSSTPSKDLKPVGTYVLTIQTASTAGKPAETFEVRLTDRGTGPVIGQLGGPRVRGRPLAPRHARRRLRRSLNPPPTTPPPCRRHESTSPRERVSSDAGAGTSGTGVAVWSRVNGQGPRVTVLRELLRQRVSTVGDP